MSEVQRKTKLEIIDETVAYYSEDVSRRGLNDEFGSCEYLTSDGRMCAVGRCIDQSTLEHRLSFYSGSIKVLLNRNFPTDNRFKDDNFYEAYRGHEVEFWRDIQELHDLGFYWNYSGLNEVGKKVVEQIKRKWNNR